MSLFFAKVSFLAADGRRGRSDWAVEASHRDHALQLIQHRLGRDGRILLSIEITPITIDQATDEHFGVVGLLDMLREGPVHWQNQPDGAALQIAEALPDADPAGVPDWIAPPYWRALFAMRKTTTQAGTAQDDHSYVVIDPTTWPSRHGSLAEDIAASNLPATCLFNAAPHSDQAESAPWLVDLTPPPGPLDDPPSSLHRRAFARGTGPDGLLFLRSTLDLDGLRAQLRKLTRVQDLDGKWYFNRFWEPEFFLYMLYFLEGRRLLAPLAQLTGFAFAAEGRIISGRTDLRASLTAPQDRAADLDLLFDAGTAMVALRHSRRLEKEFGKNCDPDSVYALAKDRFGLSAMDYRFVMKCIEITYSAISFFGPHAQTRLDDGLMRNCFDDDGQLSPFIELLHGQCMFGLRHDISPDLLRSEVRFGT